MPFRSVWISIFHSPFINYVTYVGLISIFKVTVFVSSQFDVCAEHLSSHSEVVYRFMTLYKFIDTWHSWSLKPCASDWRNLEAVMKQSFCPGMTILVVYSWHYIMKISSGYDKFLKYVNIIAYDVNSYECTCAWAYVCIRIRAAISVYIIIHLS